MIGNETVVGTCSLCGGDLVVPIAWWGTVPPPVQCKVCFATKGQFNEYYPWYPYYPQPDPWIPDITIPISPTTGKTFTTGTVTITEWEEILKKMAEEEQRKHASAPKKEPKVRTDVAMVLRQIKQLKKELERLQDLIIDVVCEEPELTNADLDEE